MGAGGEGTGMRLWTRSRAVATQAEYEAEDPSPALIGRVDRAIKWNEGLEGNEQCKKETDSECVGKSTTSRPHELETCTSTRTLGLLHVLLEASPLLEEGLLQ